MYEKVNPAHPDKIADRIAGALVDLAYTLDENPKIAVEVLIGHGVCTIISETSVELPRDEVGRIVARIAGDGSTVLYHEERQDAHLAANQQGEIRCGDNGIFKGMPQTPEEAQLGAVARNIYHSFPTDGKYVIDQENRRLIVCQSNADAKGIMRCCRLPTWAGPRSTRLAIGRAARTWTPGPPTGSWAAIWAAR